MRPIALARLLQLSSQALPIGGYSHSQGLEAAIDQRVVTDEGSLLRWISDVLEFSMKSFEIPSMLSMAAAWARNDPAAIAALNEEFSRDPGVRGDSRGGRADGILPVLAGLYAAGSAARHHRHAALDSGTQLALRVERGDHGVGDRAAGFRPGISLDVGRESGVGCHEGGADRSIRGATRLARDGVQDRRRRARQR